MDKIWSDFQKRYGDNTQSVSVTVCVNWNDLVKVFENNNNSASTAFVRNYYARNAFNDHNVFGMNSFTTPRERAVLANVGQGRSGQN